MSHLEVAGEVIKAIKQSRQELDSALEASLRYQMECESKGDHASPEMLAALRQGVADAREALNVAYGALQSLN